MALGQLVKSSALGHTESKNYRIGVPEAVAAIIYFKHLCEVWLSRDRDSWRTGSVSPLSKYSPRTSHRASTSSGTGIKMNGMWSVYLRETELEHRMLSVMEECSGGLGNS